VPPPSKILDPPLSARSEESAILSEKAELVEWLKNHLPLTHTISRDIISNSNIRIWIVKQ